MLRALLFLVPLFALLSSCELIVIGTQKETPITIDQNSPIGAVYLFKTELDSNNTRAATQIMARPGGQMYLAIEKYDMYFEMARLGRVIGRMPVTDVRADTLASDSARINLELDYYKTISFGATKISDNWYITDYKE